MTSRFFNTAGPCNPEQHYMVSPETRLVEINVRQLIRQQAYFVLHAPRQVGKTTTMRQLARELTASGEYTAALVSLEVGAGFPDDINQAELAILASWRNQLLFELPEELHPPTWPEVSAGQRFGAALQAWAVASPRPLVVFLDEVDALENQVLISVLRQLRAGYPQRPRGFPASLAIVGLRDVRDYKIVVGGSQRLNSPSPFNIAVRSITMRNFNQTEVAHLLQQYRNESGQPFTDEAISHIFYLSGGQPWLVNVLAKVSVEELVPTINQPVTVEHINQAKEITIARRQTHLDQLTDKLREPRVRRVIEPLMAGDVLADVPPDDIDYVLDLGLCRIDPLHGIVVANPIYQEILPRSLANTAYISIPYLRPIWLNADGSLNPDQLLAAFLSFWRQHGQPLLGSTHYHEIAPHLVMMAFLHRVVNRQGTVEREYAIGTGKMDLCLRYGAVTLAMELKVWRDGKPDPLARGLNQLDEYLSGLSLQTGWLVIFDQRSNLPDISERTTTEMATTPQGRLVTVIRG